MDRASTVASAANIGKTKDDIINEAHKARQVRELSRLRERSAIIIQASFKTILVRKKLKREANKELDELIKSPSLLANRDILTISKKILFISHRDRDKQTLISLIELILSQLEEHNLIEVNFHAKTQQIERVDIASEEMPRIPINSLIENGDESFDCDTETPGKNNSLEKTIACLSQTDEPLSHAWLDTLERIMDLCVYYLKSTYFSQLDSPNMDLYLKAINKLTSISLNDEVVVGTPSIQLTMISSKLFERLSDAKNDFFEFITNFICENINRIKSDLKCSILFNYAQLLTRRIHQDILSESETNRKELTNIIISMLCIPCFIYHLQTFSVMALQEISKQSIYKITIQLLGEVLDFQKLTSTSSLCVLANIIHLSSMNEEDFKQNKMDFVNLIVKLLESCQKNMLNLSLTKGGATKLNKNIQSSRKKNDSKDVSFNPLLGWLAREQATSIDKDIIKLQLNYLWSIKYIKILLSDLSKFSLRNPTTGQVIINNKAQISSPNSIFKTSTTRSNLHNQIICDNSLSNPNSNLFRRAVERVTLSMARTLSCSYAKTTVASNNSIVNKLLSAETTRISIVCRMFYIALNTLSALKQEILNGLCLHEYILPNLWIFISCIGSQNGLKAFLEHLTICTKTNAPEFFILILFCECASHLISVLDDTELYEKQAPFRLEDLIAISAFLNNFVYGIISNNLIMYNPYDVDPLLKVTHKLLTDLYKRDCRRNFSSPDHWLIKDIKISVFLKDLDAGKAVSKTIMTLLPHIIPRKERVIIFRNLIAKDKAQNSSGLSTLITINRNNIVEDGYSQLARLQPQALKGLIRVTFINNFGLDEAGLDQDGVFKEFLEDTIKKVFDPALNLFCSTSEQRLYPSPTARLDENYLSLFNFVGKILGKAIYEGIVVDVPFASFFLSRVLGKPQAPLYSPIDELPSLDPELYKSLTYIKHYEGDVSELDLTFSIDHDFLGKIETYELEPGGRSIPVTRETRVRYIHSVANFRMKTQIEKQTEAFVAGFKSIINLEWLSMFSTSEFQRIISGDTTPIDLQDLRRNTKYFGGFHNNHRVVCWLWDILEKDYTPEEHSLFLKFVTSCSKPPLLGFVNLEPKFSIRCVEVGDDQDLGDTVGSVIRGYLAIRRSDPVDRLPTSATCFNMLKLPNYQRRSTLRDKLRYAIRSNPGFELS